MDDRRKVVLGLGNLLQQDDGFGVRVVQALERELGIEMERARVELVDGGTLGLSLLPLVEECSHLLVVDAVEAGLAPGALVELSKDQIPLFSGIKLSQHQVTFQEVLALAGLREHLPDQVYLIGIQPAETGDSLDLSETVEKMLPEAILRAVQVLRDWRIF
jgi:hydrogenase maturation protease